MADRHNGGEEKLERNWGEFGETTILTEVFWKKITILP